MKESITPKQSTYRAEALVSAAITVQASDYAEAMYKAKSELRRQAENKKGLEVFAVIVGNLDIAKETGKE